MSDSKSKQARFEELLNNYAVASYVTDQLMTSGLLEKKIKLGVDVDKIDNFVEVVLPYIANSIRRGNKLKASKIKDPYEAKDIANAYFTELNTYGGEWEYADLEDLFINLKEDAEQEIEDDKDRW